MPEPGKRGDIVLLLIQQLHIVGQVTDHLPLVGFHLHGEPSLQPGNVPGDFLE